MSRQQQIEAAFASEMSGMEHGGRVKLSFMLMSHLKYIFLPNSFTQHTLQLSCNWVKHKSLFSVVITHKLNKTTVNLAPDIGHLIQSLSLTVTPVITNLLLTVTLFCFPGTVIVKDGYCI